MTSKELRVHTKLVISRSRAINHFVFVKGNLGGDYAKDAQEKAATKIVRYSKWLSHLKTKYGLDIA